MTIWVTDFFDGDLTDVHIVLVLGLFGSGLVLMCRRSVRSWRAATVAFLAVTALWIAIWLRSLQSATVGSDCNQPHHDGELPTVAVSVAWCVVLVATLFVRRSMLASGGTRVALPVGTAAVVGGTLLYIWNVQPVC